MNDAKRSALSVFLVRNDAGDVDRDATLANVTLAIADYQASQEATLARIAETAQAVALGQFAGISPNKEAWCSAIVAALGVPVSAFTEVKARVNDYLSTSRNFRCKRGPGAGTSYLATEAERVVRDAELLTEAAEKPAKQAARKAKKDEKEALVLLAKQLIAAQAQKTG